MSKNGGLWNASEGSALEDLDDIIVMTFVEHLKNMGEVLQRISMAGLKLSVKKYAFF